MRFGKIKKKMLYFVIMVIVLQTTSFANGYDFNIYGTEDTLKRKNDPVFKMEEKFPEVFKVKEYWAEDGDDKGMLKEFEEFLIKYMPKEYHDLDIYITPYNYQSSKAFYTNNRNFSYRPTIVIAASEYFGIGSFYHEMGHLISDKTLDNNGWEQYEKKLVKVGLRKQDNLSAWDLDIQESYAEDFKAYILYSLKGISFQNAADQKRTIYPFTHEMIKEFDRMFPEIKKERDRQKNVGGMIMSSWAREDVDKFFSNGFILDENDFTQALTRDQFANMAVQLFELKNGEIVNYISAFEDTDKDYISKAATIGIIKGRSNTVFAPNDKIKREEIYIIVERLQPLLNRRITINRKIKNRDTLLEEGIAIINRFY